MHVGLHVCADICMSVLKWPLVHSNVRSLIGVLPFCLYNFIHHFLF